MICKGVQLIIKPPPFPSHSVHLSPLPSHPHLHFSGLLHVEESSLSLSLFLMKLQPTKILLKQADLVCACQSRRDAALNISPASPSLRTWTGSCCLGSSCAASSARPDISPDSPLYSCVPPGISSGQPAGGDREQTRSMKRPQIKSLWSRWISRLGGAIC